MTGRLIAHYEILETLGEGGMGVVYKARDTHLDRFVAIKLLSTTLTFDASRLARFIQEAKIASALNHPNIITIHDIARDQDVTFIAMEYVKGQTLEAVIGRRGLPVKEAVRYAIEIADALSAAHSAGIIHRDLKPTNVMVTAPHRVKLLDFGLAKLRETAVSDDESTRTVGPRTTEGTIVGTLAYMSPEQAQGGAVDTRSDLFAFGAVLYEMLTGRRAFRGTTSLSVLAAILKQEPESLGTVIPGVPAELERVVRRCLRKDPARRFQNAADLKVALEEVVDESGETPAAHRHAPSTWRWLALALLLLVLVTGAGLYSLLLRRTMRASPLLVLRRVTSDTGLTTDPSLSPNGTLVAYTSDRSGEGNLDIWVQPVSGGEAIRLTKHETDDYQPAFSPDGSRIAFRSDREGGGIYIMSALGGEPRLVVQNGARPRFSPDGNYILHSSGSIVLSQLKVIAVSGGPAKRLQPDAFAARDGVWSPDGKHILFLSLSAPVGLRRGEWWISTLDGAPPIMTAAREVIDRYGLLPPPGDQDVAPSLWLENDDEVVFSARLGDSTDLWSLSVSPVTGKISGVPRRLTASTGMHLSASFAAPPSTADRRSLGAIALTNLTYDVDLWRLPLEPNHGVSQGEAKRLTDNPAPDTNVSVSGNGGRATFLSNRPGGQHVWMKDLRSGLETQLTAGNVLNWVPHISPRGDRVAYGRREDENWSLYAMPLDPTGRPGAEQQLCKHCGFPWSWSSDSSRLLYCVLPDASIGLLDVGSGFRGDVLRHPAYELWQGEFSPDDRWVAFQASAGPKARIYVVSADALRGSPPPESWTAITDDETWNDKPRWSPGGNLLYFTSERDGFRCLWMRRLDPRTKRPSGPAVVVRHFHGSRPSLAKIDYGSLEISIARDSVLMNAGELKGNIWAAEMLESK